MTDEAALLAALTAIMRNGERSANDRSPLPSPMPTGSPAAVPAAPDRLVDLGSGGGLPGLVVAVRCPWLQVTLVERRTRRADLLLRAVRSLGLGERVTVVADDVKVVAEAEPHGFEVVTARSFAAPPITACGGPVGCSPPAACWWSVSRRMKPPIVGRTALAAGLVGSGP